jgi:PhzF family phenazine biosynthesis protein
MKIKMFQVDAFTEQLFGGNPAAVCILEQWLPETLMQSIAAENNLAETAFITADEDGYGIRWFTPTVEVDLCGHATLAAAHVIFHHLDYRDNEVVFHSRNSGRLSVRRHGAMLSLDFPADEYKRVTTPLALEQALGIEPMATYKGKTDYMAVLPSEQDVASLAPNMALLNTLEARGVIVTAMGDNVDFVSRFFAPTIGHQRRSGNGIGAYYADSILGQGVRQNETFGNATISPCRASMVQAPGRSRRDKWPRSDLYASGNRSAYDTGSYSSLKRRVMLVSLRFSLMLLVRA